MKGALHYCAGGMKLTDFGLARMFGSPEAGRYTHQVRRLHESHASEPALSTIKLPLRLIIVCLGIGAQCACCFVSLSQHRRITLNRSQTMIVCQLQQFLPGAGVHALVSAAGAPVRQHMLRAGL